MATTAMITTRITILVSKLTALNQNTNSLTRSIPALTTSTCCQNAAIILCLQVLRRRSSTVTLHAQWRSAAASPVSSPADPKRPAVAGLEAQPGGMIPPPRALLVAHLLVLMDV
ncbi:hypothetical protein E3N88_28366 [Mikania micrantha]|uniref:Uncharacterized protein n=1 Tax=Mikania micrantha TaxID=192012 RepID=A0A5N6N251_9ASTR|nr:hypothetical protein E3N88_28366 [Mikania micrantha]